MRWFEEASLKSHKLFVALRALGRSKRSGNLRVERIKNLLFDSGREALRPVLVNHRMTAFIAALL